MEEHFVQITTDYIKRALKKGWEIDRVLDGIDEFVSISRKAKNVGVSPRLLQFMLEEGLKNEGNNNG